MKRSLSVFLPVQNAQQSLEPLVSSHLEILPELTRRFDIVIVDDGSHDDTVTLADEMARAYPQVRVVAHPRRQGRAAAIRSALGRSDGEVILYREPDALCEISDLERMWRLIEEFDAVLGCRTGQESSQGWGEWVAGLGLAGNNAEVLMLRRHIAQRGRFGSLRIEDLRAELSRMACRWTEIELRPSLVRAQDRSDRRDPAQNGPERVGAPHLLDHANPHTRRYLERLKQFALGE